MITSSRPAGLAKYQHVAAVLRERVHDGTYAPGEPLPAEPHLVDEFGYDRSTIRRGLALLRQEGLITSEQGRGVYVRQSQTVRHELLKVLQSEYEHAKGGEAPNRGLFELTTGVPDGALTVDHSYATVEADDDLAEAFKVEPGRQLLRRRYFFGINGEPHQITNSYVLYDMVAGTPLIDPANERPGQGTLAQLLSIGVLIDSVSVDIESRMPTPDEAASLHMAEGTPLLVDRRRSSATGKVVAVADTITPADRIKFGVDIDLAGS